MRKSSTSKPRAVHQGAHCLRHAPSRWPRRELAAARIAQLRAQVEYYRRLAEETLSLEALVNAQGRLLWINNAVEDITGYSRAECMAAANLVDLCVLPEDRKRAHVLALRALHGEGRANHELRIRRKDGSVVWYSCRWYAQRDPDGRITGVRLSGQDVQRRREVDAQLLESMTELRRAHALTDRYLQESNEDRMRLTALLDTVALGIIFIDRAQRVVYLNRRARAMWRIATDVQIDGMGGAALLELTAPMRSDDEGYRHHLNKTLLQRGTTAQFDIAMKDGRIIREVSSVVAAHADAPPIGRVWVHEDVTEMIRAQRRLIELAERDPLTSLLNRRRFMEELDRQVADAARRHVQIGLIFFDLDGFKYINDAYGHSAGDEVLVGVSSEVSAIVRRNELFFRLGGDEFALLVTDTDEDRMLQVARRVLETMSALEFHFDGHTCRISASVGIAVFPAHAREPQNLVIAADRAMYMAKSLGKNRCEVACEFHHTDTPESS